MRDAPLAFRPLDTRARIAFVGLGLAGAAVTVRVGLGSRWPYPAHGLEGLFWVWGAPALMIMLAGIALAVRAWTVPPGRALRLDDEVVWLPSGRFGSSGRAVPYARLRSVAWACGWPSTRRRLFVVDEAGRTFLYREAWLERPEALPAFAASLLERAERAAPEKAAALRARAAVGAAAAAAPIRTTPILLGLVSLAFLAQWSGGGFSTPETLWLGSAARWLVAEGEWHRVVTAAFLHAGLLHFAINAVTLALLMPMAESVLGAWRTAAVVGAAVVGSSFGHLLVEDRMTAVGISGVVYGMVGALLALNLTDRSTLPSPYWLSPPILVALGVVGVALDWMVPQAGWPGHLAGLVAGVAITVCLRPGRELGLVDPAPSPALRWGVIFVGVVFAIACGAGVRAAAATHATEVVRRSALLLVERLPMSIVFEVYATMVSARPDVRREDLESLRGIALERAERHAGPSAGVAASIERMLGRSDEALALQERAAHGTRDPRLLRELAVHRFEAFTSGRIDPGRFGARVRVDPSERLEVVLDTAWPEGFLLDAVFLRDGRLVGVLRMSGGVGVSGRVVSEATLGVVSSGPSLPETVVVDLRPLEPDDYPHAQPGQLTWWAHPIEADAPPLPQPLAE